MSKYLVYIVAVLLFVGCQTNPKHLIKEYEFIENALRISAFTSIGQFQPFYAHDSILILDVEYDSVLNKKLAALHMQLNERVTVRQKAEVDLQSSQSPLMKKTIANRIQLILHEEESLNNIIANYVNFPEQTQLNTFIKARKAYSQLPDSILGYTLKASFKGNFGRLGSEDFNREYFFCSDKSILIGHLQP